MRNILHHPHFQSIEAAWRSLDLLTRRLETGSQLQLYLIDVSKEELRSELNVDDLSQSHVHKLLCDPTSITIPWSLLVGNFCFDATLEDTDLLKRLGSIAMQCNAPFLAAAHPHWVQCESLWDTADSDEWQLPIAAPTLTAWQHLRQQPTADYLGLTIPRFILRTPYGKKTSPIESFSFEEMSSQHCHNCYLWGNGAIVLSYLLASSFIDKGWRMRPGDIIQMDKLPLHYFEDESNTVPKPCAEIYLTERAIRKILQQGLIPLCSVRGSDSVRCSSFNSMSSSQTTLRGRWHPS
jgi:type VI secretion system protein ImpC